MYYTNFTQSSSWTNRCDLFTNLCHGKSSRSSWRTNQYTIGSEISIDGLLSIISKKNTRYINEFLWSRSMKINISYWQFHILSNDRIIERMWLKFVKLMAYGCRLIAMNRCLIRIKFVEREDREEKDEFLVWSFRTNVLSNVHWINRQAVQLFLV